MKKLFILFVLFSLMAFAQTTTKWNVQNLGNGTQVEWTFTSGDSATGFVSPVFSLGKGSYDFTQQGVFFLKKFVSTYAVPIADVYLQFVGSAGTDTSTIDTLCTQSITESDTSGVSVFSYTTAGKNVQAGKWRIFIRSLPADINTGKLFVFFPKRRSS